MHIASMCPLIPRVGGIPGAAQSTGHFSPVGARHRADDFHPVDCLDTPSIAEMSTRAPRRRRAQRTVVERIGDARAASRPAATDRGDVVGMRSRFLCGDEPRPHPHARGTRSKNSGRRHGRRRCPPPAARTGTSTRVPEHLAEQRQQRGARRGSAPAGLDTLGASTISAPPRTAARASATRPAS